MRCWPLSGSLPKGCSRPSSCGVTAAAASDLLLLLRSCLYTANRGSDAILSGKGKKLARVHTEARCVQPTTAPHEPPEMPPHPPGWLPLGRRPALPPWARLPPLLGQGRVRGPAPVPASALGRGPLPASASGPAASRTQRRPKQAPGLARQGPTHAGGQEGCELSCMVVGVVGVPFPSLPPQSLGTYWSPPCPCGPSGAEQRGGPPPLTYL